MSPTDFEFLMNLIGPRVHGRVRSISVRERKLQVNYDTVEENDMVCFLRQDSPEHDLFKEYVKEIKPTEEDRYKGTSLRIEINLSYRCITDEQAPFIKKFVESNQTDNPRRVQDIKFTIGGYVHNEGYSSKPDLYGLVHTVLHVPAINSEYNIDLNIFLPELPPKKEDTHDDL